MNQLRKKRVTLRDVAELAKVSEKTVSNVINDWPFVSAETRNRVKQALTTTGYRPSHVARSLVTGRTRTVGIVAPDISNPFFSSAFRGCEDKLTAYDYSVILCNTDEDLAKERYYLESLVDRGVDGLILWGSQADASVLCAAVGDDTPIVVIDGSTRTGPARFTAIVLDNVGGAERAVQHLVRSGRRRVAYLSGASHRLTTHERLRGYRQALAGASLPFCEAWVGEGSPSIGGGYTVAMKLLQLSIAERPDALFCFNDLMAIGAIAAAEELGIKVPDDLAVVGFDDIAPATLVTPMLTTVRIPQYELGQFAVDELMQRLADPALPARVVEYPPLELKIRNSCGTHRLTIDERRLALRQLATSAGVGLPLSNG